MRAHPLNKNVSEALVVADPGEGPGRGAPPPAPLSQGLGDCPPLSEGLDLPLSCVAFCKLPLETQYCQYSRTFFMLVSKPIQTRTLLVALSLACLETSINVKDPGAVILLFRFKYKTSVVCYNVYTQKVKIARRDRLHILASNRCETYENLLHIDIAPLRSTLSGILHSKN